MKFKFLSVTFLFLMMGMMASAIAQEGEDFWTEKEEKKEGEKKESKAPTNSSQPKLKPVENSCENRNELREEVRLLIRPFKYNLSKTTMITFKRYPQLVRVLIPIYNSNDHRVIFSTKGLPQNISIKVYDKAKGEKKRSLLFESNPDEPINTFELTEDFKGSYLFVEYMVPPTDAEDRSYTSRGCVVMMMGYLFLLEDESEGTMETN
jgi:Na+-transporting methylmalonyl-CoA/oxaloacetate decarboxylase gamma subunit